MGVAVVAVADPRQVFTLLLALLSTPYGGGVLVRAQLENMSTPDGGLHYTLKDCIS
jgi:hypothetical protein